MPELTGHMLHFAYGVDLPRAEFTRSCPGAEWFGPARLEGHRLVFDSSGRPNVRADSAGTVWGALWLVPAARLPELDAGAGEGYERTTRRIVSPAGPRTEATLYLSADPGEGVPSPALLEALLAGAKESRLPAAYVQELKAAGTGGKLRKDSR
jgi:gamma-glutamylcyclotransferase (GGCT)/AIG2-like uncharacterized protein YtfP